MKFAEFISNLSFQLTQPSSTYDEIVQKMSPAHRLRMNTQPNENTRRSAVLILFYPIGEVAYLPLILRPKYDGVHGGQMAFPGGRMEESDKSIQHTAVREAQEEIGIKASDVKILGNLTEIFISPSNLFCQPVLGYLPYKPDFYPDQREVAEIFHVDIAEILNPHAVEIRTIETKTFTLDTYCYIIQEQTVWGATALMIAELVEVLKRTV
jgi:8-oxo-dGTP pyrophosphatase MutT (NUDIX family)